MMLSSFTLPDKRLIIADKQLYKVLVRSKGSIKLTQEELDEELEQIIRVLITQLSGDLKTVLYTKHLLAECKLVTWPVAEKLDFYQHQQKLQTFNRALEITIHEKKQTDVQQAKRRLHASSSVSSHVKRLRSSYQIDDDRSLDHGEVGKSVHEENQLEHNTVASVTNHRMCDARPSLRLCRDRKLISLDDAEENRKLHKLVEPSSPKQSSRHERFIDRMVDLLFTPVKRILGDK